MTEGELQFKEPTTDKEARWREVESQLEKYSGIEDGIRETVMGLNVFDIETMNSCEGHHNRGRIAPWVSIEKWESKPQERYVGQKEFEQQIYERLGVLDVNKRNLDYVKEHDEMAASFLPPGQVEFDNLSEDARTEMVKRDQGLMKKYGITPDDTKKWMDAGMQAEIEIEQAGKDGRLQETEAYKQWKIENDATKEKLQKLLDEFYKDKEVDEDVRLIIDKDGSGSWCVHNGGKNYYDVTRRQDEIPSQEKDYYQEILDGKNPEQEQRELEERVKKYRTEFKEFAAFLKQKFYKE